MEIDQNPEKEDWVFDSALIHNLSYMLERYAVGHPDALADAVALCEKQGLFGSADLDPELDQLVKAVAAHRDAPSSRRRTLRRGRQSETLSHVVRHSRVERTMGEMTKRGERPSVRKASEAVASTPPHVSAETIRSSYKLVEEADDDLIGDGYIRQRSETD